VGRLIVEILEEQIRNAEKQSEAVEGVGISVPGIYYPDTGTVWAPNIEGWEAYPLLNQIKSDVRFKDRSVRIENDRACYILGECWRGTAQGCRDAIFIAVGTGIGAGILIDGSVLHGHHDIAGAIGWMALERPFHSKFKSCGNFEYHASGAGLVRYTRELLDNNPHYKGILSKETERTLTAPDIFDAYNKHDTIAVQVIENAITLWGMAAANMVSIFNPEIIILGGGIFGPAAQFLDRITEEMHQWAQPISAGKVKLVLSRLGGDAGLYGAAYLGLNKKNSFT
jgi:glucokinase